MDLASKLESERRTRLATERMLSQMKRELGDANRRLALQAQQLTTELRSNRKEIGRARTEAKHLKHEVSFAQQNLAKAENAMVIAERRLWDSLEAIRDGFAVFGPDERLIAANRSYLSMFDGLEMVQPGAEMALLIELLADEGIVDIGEVTSAEWQRFMLARVREPRIEYATLKLWNGQYIQFIERRTPTGDLVTLALNITDQTRREAQLDEARLRAEAANRAKSAFLANMSHEIRTPMNGVVAMADLLSETDLDDEQQSYLETIRSSGEALLVIINDVLDYSKIEADKIEFKNAPFDLERCLHDIISLLLPSAMDKGLQLAIDFDLFLPTMFEGDVGRVRQVLTNLLGNALKFTEAGHVLVRVVGLPGDDEMPYQVCITVEDTGIGIPEDKLDSIFQDFSQVENDYNRGHDGTGLGLAITQKLVRAMGGDIWVESTLGEGSGFGFTMPLPVVEEVAPETLRAPDWMRRAIVMDRPGMNRQVLIKQLGQIGLETVGAETLEDVKAALPTEADVVFLEAASIHGDAYEEAEALRRAGPLGGLFLLVNSSAKLPDRETMAYDVYLKRPVMRATMIRELTEMEAPSAERVPEPEVVAVETETLEVVEAPPEPPEPLDAGPRRMRVLAAEDNKTNRFVFQKILKALDIDLIFAENGLEAVEAYEAEPPDIFFTDISMPKMDGKEATRRVREIEAERGLDPCPIIAITAHAMEGDADDILAAGCDKYLTKPLKKQLIHDEIISAQPLDARPALPLPDEPGDGLPEAETG